MSIARVINRTLKKNLHHYVAWMPLSDRYSIGDYGIFKGGVFQAIGNIKDFGVDPEVAQGGSVSFVYASENMTSVRTVAGVATPVAVFPDAPVEAELQLSFESANSVFVRAQTTVEQMTNVDAAARKLRDASASDGRKWKRRWKVVRKIYTAKDPLLLASTEANTQFSVSAQANVLKAIELGGGHAAVGVTASSGSAFHVYQGEGPLALDLFSLEWFGGTRLEHTGADWSPDDDWPEELPDDPPQALGLRSPWAMLEAAAQQQEYSLEGPWNYGDPVHETLTLTALERARIEGEERDIYEYVRGAFWNDDPQCLLFDERADRADDFSSGLTFLRDFKKAEKAARQGKQFGSADPLLARSHFGDLQFLHSMANRDGIAPEETLEYILDWCIFCWRVAGTSDETRTLESFEVERLSALFSNARALTPRGLFQTERYGSARSRALGSLLHTLQDSYASGHVERVENGARRGDILCFYSYANQDHGLHAADDGWREGDSGPNRIAGIKGGTDALEVSGQVLHLFKSGASEQQLVDHLKRGPLKLAAGARPSGPGAGYQK